MALRRALALNLTTGRMESIPTTDSMELGGLTLGGTLAFSTPSRITGLDAANTNGDAIAYGQTGASLGDLTLTGALTGVGATFSDPIVVGTPTAGNHAATRTFVENLANGWENKQSVRALATGNITLSGTQTIDGVALVAGNRVAVAGQTNAVDNGIYVVAAGAWARADDFATGSTVRSAYFWVNEGTTYGDTGWVTLNDAGGDVVGTDELTFSQAASAAVTLPGDGLIKDGNYFHVKAGAGLTASADNVALELAATDPGLEFDAVGDDGRLRVKIDDGIQRTAAGIGVKLDGSTLGKGTEGLKALGLPALFTIAGVAVGANVTAANLGTLTNGGDASALHYHAAQAATEAPLVRIPVGTAAGAIAKGEPVCVVGNDSVNRALGNTAGRNTVIGVAPAAIANGAAAHVIRAGVATGVLTGATANTTYYLGPNGGLVTWADLAVNDEVVKMGVALNATDLLVEIQEFGTKAA